MKKVILPLVLILVAFQLNAQKSFSDVKQVIEKAKSDTENPKKATNPKTWMALANAYTAYYDVPVNGRGVWAGAKQIEVKMLLKDQQILSTSQKTINNKNYDVDSYADKDLYYEAGVLAFWTVKGSEIENPLYDAYKSLVKASEVDVKKSKSKDIIEAMKALKTSMFNNALNSYNFGDNKKATEYFENVIEIDDNPLINILDTTVIYYASVTAGLDGNYDKSIKYLKKCLDNNFDQKGVVYASLAECYKAIKDTMQAKEILSIGFSKYPTNQDVLVALINLYMDSKDDPKKVLALIQKAQANEPNNASLYLAEGNVYSKLEDLDAAIVSYKKSTEVDPNYVFGFLYQGITYYNKALKIQTDANSEADDAKYNAMLVKLEESLKSAIDPFEVAFDKATTKDVKNYAAEYLKNIYYRFRDKDAAFKTKYEQYNKFVEENK
jgi:tetratricopeptide (TPR) repeat protein